jgi:hypothetical protein
MPNYLLPADSFTAIIRMIACPDCPERPGCNVHSPNPEVPELCPTCAGYGDIMAPEEVERYRRKAIQRSEVLKELPRPDFEERRWRFGS